MILALIVLAVTSLAELAALVHIVRGQADERRHLVNLLVTDTPEQAAILHRATEPAERNAARPERTPRPQPIGLGGL